MCIKTSNVTDVAPLTTVGPVADHAFYIDVRADWRQMNFNALAEKTQPLTSNYFLRNETGVKDMRRWLNATDVQIKERRAGLARFLKERFGIIVAPFDKA